MHSDADIETSEARVAAEVETSIARARQAISGQGSAECSTCGAVIEPARRAALPSAVTCISCATKAERGRR